MSKSHVSLEQHQCMLCLECFDTGNILLDRRLRQSMEHKTVTGQGFCPTCEERMNQDYIALVGAIPHSKTAKTAKPDEVDRTGDLIWMKRAVFSDFFDVPAPERGIVFVDPEVVAKIHALMPESDNASPSQDESPK